MFIATAVYDQKNIGLTTLKICTADEADISLESIFSGRLNPESKEMCCRYDNEFIQKIMKLAATEKLPVQFEYHRNSYTLISYTYNDKEREFNKYRANYITATKRIAFHDEIIIYTKRCNCPRCFSEYGWESIENICGWVSAENGSKVKIDIQRCNHCGLYFMDEQSLNIYEKRYGRLKIHRCPMKDFIRRVRFRQDKDIYAPDSILSRNGYLTKYDIHRRRKALIMMMYNGISKAEIKDKLAEFIYYRGKKCHIAENIWKEDLNFVNDYHLEKEEQILFVDRKREIK